LNKVHPVRKRHWVGESVSSLFFEFISCCGAKGGVIPPSEFSPKAKHAFITLYAKALQVDYRATDESIANFGSRKTLAMDINKAYSSALAAPEDKIAHFTFLDQFVKYNPSDPNHNSIRDCWLELERPVNGRTLIHASYARSMFDTKVLKHSYIKNIFIPSYVYERDLYADAMKKWFALDISDRTKKDGPNHWIGTQTKRFGRKTKYMITDHYNEYEAALRDHPSLQVRKFGDLYYCYKEEEWVLPKSSNPFAFQIIDQVNGNALRLKYRFERNKHVICLGIKSDCVFGHLKGSSERDEVVKSIATTVSTYKDIDGVEITKEVKWDPVAICKSYGAHEKKTKGIKYIGEPVLKFVMGDAPGQLRIDEGVNRYTSPYEEEKINIENLEYKASAIPGIPISREYKPSSKINDAETGGSVKDTRKKHRYRDTTIPEMCALSPDRYASKPWNAASEKCIIEDFQCVIEEDKNSDTKTDIVSKKEETQRKIDEVVRQNSLSGREKYEEKMKKLFPVNSNKTVHGGCITGAPGTAKTRLLTKLYKMAVDAGVKVVTVTFKGASSNNLLVKSVDSSTIDSFLDTELRADPAAVLRKAIYKLKNLKTKAILVDEFAEIPEHHMIMLLRLAVHFPIYFFGDPKQASPAYAKRLYEYIELDTFKRACGHRHAHLEYNWDPKLKGKQRCSRNLVLMHEELARSGRLNTGWRQKYEKLGCVDEERRCEEWIPSKRVWVPKTPIIETYEYFPVEVINKLINKDWTTNKKHRSWRVKSVISEILSQTDYGIHDHHGVPCYRQSVKYFERGLPGTRIYAGDGAYQNLNSRFKALLLHGLYLDFDQGASHQYAIVNICRRYSIPCSVLEDYVKNYKNWRIDIAEYYTVAEKGVRCPISAAKQMITAINYGSGLNSFGLKRAKRKRGRVNQHSFFDKNWPQRDHEADAFATYYRNNPYHPKLVALKNEMAKIIRLFRGNKEFEGIVADMTAHSMKYNKRYRDIRVTAMCTWAQKVETEINLCINSYFGDNNVNGLIHDGLGVNAAVVEAKGGRDVVIEKVKQFVTEKTGYEFILKIKPFEIEKARKWLDTVPDLKTPVSVKEYLPLNHIVKYHKTGQKWNERIMNALVDLSPEEPVLIIGKPTKAGKKSKWTTKMEWRLPGYKLIKGMRITTRCNLKLDNHKGERIRIHNAARGTIMLVDPAQKYMVVEWSIGPSTEVTSLQASVFKQCCQLDYAVTVERVQGRTIDENMWIWNTQNMWLNELVMASSRCKNLGQLRIERFKKPLEWRKYDVLPSKSICTKVYAQIWTYAGLDQPLYRIIGDPGNIKKITVKDAYTALRYGKSNYNKTKEQRAEEKKNKQIVSTEKPCILSQGYFASEDHLVRAVRKLKAVHTRTIKKKKGDTVEVSKCTKLRFKRSKIAHVMIDEKEQRLKAFWWQVEMVQIVEAPGEDQGGQWQFARGDLKRCTFSKRYKKIGLAAAEALLIENIPKRYKLHRKNYEDPTPKAIVKGRGNIQFVQDADGRYFPSVESMEHCLAAERVPATKSVPKKTVVETDTKKEADEIFKISEYVEMPKVKPDPTKKCTGLGGICGIPDISGCRVLCFSCTKKRARAARRLKR